MKNRRRRRLLSWLEKSVISRHVFFIVPALHLTRSTRNASANSWGGVVNVFVRGSASGVSDTHPNWVVAGTTAYLDLRQRR